MRISFIGDVLHISGLINSVPAKLRPAAGQLQLPELICTPCVCALPRQEEGMALCSAR
jgi:hypothetical protein